MRKIWIALILILSMTVAVSAQQNRVLTAASATCTTASCLTVTVDPTQGGATLTVSANASGNTISFEASGDGGTTVVALNATPSNSSTAASSTTSTGTWQVNTAGYTNIYLIMTTLVSGTTTVSIIQSTASARGGSGAGGGGAIVSCTTSNGILYQNGTNNTATCGPNLEWFDNLTWGALVFNGQFVQTTNADLTGSTTGGLNSCTGTVGTISSPGFACTVANLEVTNTSPTVDAGSPYYGLVGQADAEGSGTIAEVVGVRGIGSAGAGTTTPDPTVTLAVGVLGENNIPATATTTYAFEATAPSTEGIGTVGTAEGLHIDNMMVNTPRPSASVGLHIDAQTNGGTAIEVDGGGITTDSLTASATVRANTSFNANGTAGISSSGIICSGTFTSVLGIVTACTAVSDARLKMGIRPYRAGLNQILKLHPALYEMNSDGQRITGLPATMELAGFIGQDVQKTIPKAVGSETHDGVDYLTVEDRPILAALVNAVKEQQREIVKLKKEITIITGKR